jgi:alkylated DNA repair dioxygenase AlkB
VFWQTSLFGDVAPRYDASFAQLHRVDLDATSWVDHAPGWVAGSDQLLEELANVLPLRQKKGVKMYDQVLDEPRLTAWWSLDSGQAEPLPILAEMRTLLAERYDEPYDSIGFNLYRDGNDSVAWHGDRHRHRKVNPTVAIVSLGAPRPFPPAATRRGQFAVVATRPRRSVGDGGRMSAQLGAQRSQGTQGHRPAHERHVPIVVTPGAGQPACASTASAAIAEPLAPAMSRSATSAKLVTSRCSSRNSVYARTRSRNQSRNSGVVSITPPPMK